MSDKYSKPEFGVMLLRRANGAKLISAPIAVEIARLLLKNEHGQQELERNEPLSVVEEDETWIVQGHDHPGQDERAPQIPIWAGPLRMRISQWDGQILEFVFLMDMAKAAQTPQQEKKL